jgi:hypothetical protein
MNDQPPTTQSGFVPGAVPGDPRAEKLNQDAAAANVKRGIELGEFTLSIFKTTLGHAAKTYRRITWMNYAMLIAPRRDFRAAT